MEARNAGLMQEAMGIGNENIAQMLVTKWAPYLRGLPQTKARPLAFMFENTLRHLEHAIQEDTLSGNVASYVKTIFPLLRKVFPNLIANDILSVQPMTGPVGAVFYFDYRYSDSKGTAVAGTDMIDTLNVNYTAEFVDVEALATGDGAQYGGVGAAFNGNLAFRPVRPKNTTTGHVVTISATKAGGIAAQELTDNGSGTFTGDGAGSINYTTGRIYNILFTVAPGVASAITASYWYNSELNDQIPEIDINIAMSEIRAQTRKLRARWSSEATDDMRHLFGLDIEADLINGMASQMSLEIDREFIADLVANALYPDTYDFTPTGAADELQTIRGVLTVLSTVSAKIHKGSKRAPANFIVTSPRIAGFLEQLTTHGDFLPAFAMNPSTPYAALQPTDRPSSYGTTTSDFGVYFFGTLIKRYRVYVDPYLADGTILMGFKGNSFLDAGFVYAPYIPLQMTQTLADPDDFSSRKGLRTRYGKKLLRSNMYGVIECTLP